MASIPASTSLLCCMSQSAVSALLINSSEADGSLSNSSNLKSIIIHKPRLAFVLLSNGTPESHHNRGLYTTGLRSPTCIM